MKEQQVNHTGKCVVCGKLLSENSPITKLYCSSYCQYKAYVARKIKEKINA